MPTLAHDVLGADPLIPQPRAANRSRPLSPLLLAGAPPPPLRPPRQLSSVCAECSASHAGGWAPAGGVRWRRGEDTDGGCTGTGTAGHYS